MTPQTPVSIRVDDNIIDRLRSIQERDGIPQAEQIRRALRAWLIDYDRTEDRPRLTLSVVERWLLSNQLRLLESAYPDEAKFYAEKREALDEGYVHDYGPPSYMSAEDVPYELSREVCDILDMYRALQSSMKHGRLGTLTDEDVAFPGFDGNEEGAHLHYATYRIEMLGHWKELRSAGGDLNSHHPTLYRYRAMLRAFVPRRGRTYLTEQQARKLLEVGESAPYLA